MQLGQECHTLGKNSNDLPRTELLYVSIWVGKMREGLVRVPGIQQCPWNDSLSGLAYTANTQ